MSEHTAVLERDEVAEARTRRERAELRRDDAVERVLDARERLEAAETDAAEAILDGREPDPELEAARRAHDDALRDAALANRALEQAREAEAEAAAQAAEARLDELRADYVDTLEELAGALAHAAKLNDRVREIHDRAKDLTRKGAGEYGGLSPASSIPVVALPGPLPDCRWNGRGLTLARSRSSINVLRHWWGWVQEQLPDLELPPLDESA